MPTIPKVKKPRAKKPATTAPSDRVFLTGCALCGMMACATTKGTPEYFARECVAYADATIAKLKESD